MKIAWNEMKYQPKKFILIELLITILMFMVVFLSGLTNGLGRSVSAQIDNYGALHYILSMDSEGIILFNHYGERFRRDPKDRGGGLFWLVHPAGNRLKNRGFQYSGYHLLRD